jgi:hypothetical protein
MGTEIFLVSELKNQRLFNWRIFLRSMPLTQLSNLTVDMTGYQRCTAHSASSGPETDLKIL